MWLDIYHPLKLYLIISRVSYNDQDVTNLRSLINYTIMHPTLILNLRLIEN